jgi:hypothetical protein
MSLVLDHPHLTDTLRYKVFSHRRVSQDEVRVAVQVIALVPASDRDQKALEARIREALQAFVSGDWILARIERSSDATGYERVSVSAGARVAASENYDLAERARRASRDGLALTKPEVSYALSRSRVNEIVSELMAEVLVKVGRDAATFNKVTGRAWRIGDVEFGVADMPGDSGRSSKGAYRAEDIGDLLSSLEEQEGHDMAGSERIWIVAAVTLKSAPD